ncbi:MAG TPA: hypothetical protein VML55_06005 [Planctomycetaceae bacterium]|nr:hypothetical protein [Planctomycetaceae bacterium]
MPDSRNIFAARTPFRGLQRLFGGVVLLAAFTGPAGLASADDTARQEGFDRDPGWEACQNRLLPERLPVVRQDFGARTSRRGVADGHFVEAWLDDLSYTASPR